MNATSTAGPEEPGTPRSPEPIARPWRRYIRFSMRGLIVLVLVIGAGLGLVRPQLRESSTMRWRRSHTPGAGSFIIGSGGTEWRFEEANPGLRKWLADLPGVDIFGHVASVEFDAPSTPTDAVIAHVSHLTQLEQVSVFEPSLTDAKLARLQGLTKLTNLWLGGTQVTDAGLANLEGLTNLNVLAIRDAQVSDAGLKHLKRLTKLNNLYLSGTRVTDRGLEDLNGLPLWTLDLGRTAVTDAGLKHLAAMTSLKCVTIAHTQVTDAGLVHLKALTDLLQLNLGGTQLTDAGLAHLSGLTNLQYLDLDGTKVSDAGLEYLKRLTNLTWLFLKDTPVGDRGLLHLKGMTKLQSPQRRRHTGHRSWNGRAKTGSADPTDLPLIPETPASCEPETMMTPRRAPAQTIRLFRITSAYHRLLSLGVRCCVPNATWTMPNRFSYPSAHSKLSSSDQTK